MALYKYIAATRGEAPRELLIEADNPTEALGKLRSLKMVPLRALGEVGEEDGKFKLTLTRSKINVFEFTRQLSPLLDSYIPLERALNIIADSSPEGEQRQFVTSLRQGLHEGKKFSQLVRSHGRLFPGYYANLIETGEETGCLPEVTRQLYGFMEESKSLRDFIISSSIYPLAVLAITLIVTVVLFTVFVPKFAKVFLDMGKQLPFSIEFLMTVSHICLHALWLVPLLAAAIYTILLMVYGKEGLAERYADFLTKIPLLGRIMVDLDMCKYIRTLSILITNHVEIIRTVGIAGKVIQNRKVRHSFEHLDRKLKAGEKLSATLTGNEYVPRSMVAMLRVGEETGSVGEMLQRIAGNLETDTRLKIKRLLSLFEPAIIVFLALMVLTVVVAIFVAMMEMNSINTGGSSI